MRVVSLWVVFISSCNFPHFLSLFNKHICFYEQKIYIFFVFEIILWASRLELKVPLKYARFKCEQHSHHLQKNVYQNVCKPWLKSSGGGTAGLSQAPFRCQTKDENLKRSLAGHTGSPMELVLSVFFFKELKLLHVLMFLNAQGLSSGWEKVAMFPTHLMCEGTFQAWWEHAECYP